MSHTTKILLNHPVCYNPIIISSPFCLVSTIEELYPNGTKSAKIGRCCNRAVRGNEKTFMDIALDVCITHPNALSNMATPVD